MDVWRCDQHVGNVTLALSQPTGPQGFGLKFAQFGLLTALLAFGLMGCGRGDRPPLGGVTGTITMDGIPVGGLIVMFTPEKGRPAAATTNSDGTYRLEYAYGVNGANLGKNKVHFEWPMGESGPPIPSKYGQKSELTYEVTSGSNTFDFDLESDKSGKEELPVN